MSFVGLNKDLFSTCQKENLRQQNHLELIASENYASPAVMQLQGSVLTNKYAEGYPEKRYYGGCHVVDKVEQMAIDFAKQLFNCSYVNVQPHSGSQANSAVFQALMSPGDTLLGMSLSDGGHLTHGCAVNMSGINYKAFQYGLSRDGTDIDYEQVKDLALLHKPKCIIAGFSAFSGIVDWQKFREIADLVGAYLIVDMAHIAGLVAADEYPSPLPFAHVVTSTTHKTLRGPRGGIILSAEPDLDLHKKFNSGVFPGTQGGPLMHVIAAKAQAFYEALDPSFKVYQANIKANAKHMATRFIENGLKVVSNTTDNHMFLLDFIGYEHSGKVLEAALDQAHITLNKNSVPGDPRSPFQTSGLRIGTPAITTRGMGQIEVVQIADWITAVVQDPTNASLLADIAINVTNMCKGFPIYQE